MEKKIYGVIYGLIDGTNDFEYIGQTIRSVEKRFRENVIADSCVGKAIQDHGDMFIVVILKVCYNRNELDYWERRFIKSRDTLFPNGYNRTVSGGIFGESKLDETPYKNLLAEMKEFQFSYTELAKILGVMIHTVSRKMNAHENSQRKTLGFVDKLKVNNDRGK